MLVEKIIGRLEEFPIDKLTVDKVVLDHYDLAKPHQKVMSTAGESVAISLPHGESLFYGAVLYQNEEKIIVVDLEVESVIEIMPRTTIEWAGAAYNIGNMHSGAYFTENSILVPYDAALERMIKNLGVEFKRTEKKLVGLRANTYSREESHPQEHDHNHGHSHSHDHGHSHNHE